MLEWYTPEADYLTEVDRLERLFSMLPAEVSMPVPFGRITVREAVLQASKIDLDDVEDLSHFFQVAKSAGVHTSDDDTWEQIFNRIWLTFVEPDLPSDRGTIVYEYPLHVPTFAQQIEGTSYCRRWELYARGIEIANCFQEETNADRFAAMIALEAERKLQTNVVPHPPDIEILEEIRSGPMICSGVAVGVERLIMALDRHSEISQVIPFPLHHTVHP